MPEGLALAWSTPGLEWLLLAAGLAGAVYGFAGFGAALVFMPLASALIDPRLAIAAFAVSAGVSLVTVVPRAWAVAERRAVIELLVAACLTMPLGVWLLGVVDPGALRLAISLLVLATLAALMTGWRYSARPGRSARVAVGAGTGILGAATGLMGPLVILFNLGAGAPAAVTRANTLTFLTLVSILVLPQMAVQGLIGPEALWLGALLLVPYGLGGLLGQGLFRPGQETLYRGAAYAIVGVSGVLGLPIFG